MHHSYNDSMVVMQWNILCLLQIMYIYIQYSGQKTKSQMQLLNEFSEYTHMQYVQYWKDGEFQILFAFFDLFLSHIFLIKWFRMHMKYLRFSIKLLCCHHSPTISLHGWRCWFRLEEPLCWFQSLGKFICGILCIVSGIFTFSVVVCVYALWKLQGENFVECISKMVLFWISNWIQYLLKQNTRFCFRCGCQICSWPSRRHS